MLYLPSVPKPFTEEHVKFLRDTLVLFLYYERIRSSGVPQITRRTISQLARDTTENFVNKFGYDEAIGEEDQAKYFMGIRAVRTVFASTNEPLIIVRRT
jgi:hypothetical protein